MTLEPEPLEPNLTPDDASYLVVGVKPWKVRVDWTVHHAYPNDRNAKVEVFLITMGGGEHADPERETHLRYFDTEPEAVEYAVTYVLDRGHRPLMTRSLERALEEGARGLVVHAGPRWRPLVDALRPTSTDK